MSDLTKQKDNMSGCLIFFGLLLLCIGVVVYFGALGLIVLALVLLAFGVWLANT